MQRKDIETFSGPVKFSFSGLACDGQPTAVNMHKETLMRQMVSGFAVTN